MKFQPMPGPRSRRLIGRISDHLELLFLLYPLLPLNRLPRQAVPVQLTWMP